MYIGLLTYLLVGVYLSLKPGDQNPKLSEAGTAPGVLLQVGGFPDPSGIRFRRPQHLADSVSVLVHDLA